MSVPKDQAPVLEVKGLSISFGGLRALDSLNLALQRDRITGLIGPNGSGKSTLFNCISGFYRPQAGEIRLNGSSILARPPHRIANDGVARTFQNIELFRSLTAIDNLVVSATKPRGLGSFQMLLQRDSASRVVLEHGHEILSFLGIGLYANELVGTLPYGVQKLVELGRALMRKPKLILLDEPAAGTNGADLRQLMSIIQKIRDRFSATIFIIEHNLSLITELCQQVVVLNFGTKIAEGLPLEVKRDAAVVAAYLGAPKS